jgi:hypothetical protein
MNGKLMLVKNMFWIGPEGVPYAVATPRRILAKIRAKKGN